MGSGVASSDLLALNILINNNVVTKGLFRLRWQSIGPLRSVGQVSET